MQTENQVDPYNVFLIIQLAVGMRLIDENLEYDLMWAEGQQLWGKYCDYEEATPRVLELGLYEGICEFLEKYREALTFNIKSKAIVVDKVEIDVKAMSVAVCGDGFPTQVFHFDEYGEWNTIKDENELPLIDVQIDFDEGFQFQWVNLIANASGDTTQGEAWGSCDDAQIEVVNCDGYDVMDGQVVKGSYPSVELAVKAIKEKEHLWKTHNELFISPSPELVGGELLDPEEDEKPVPSELTKRFIEIFYVKYGADGDYEDDETIEELNRFFKNIR